jgi:membrane protease YdiL (CAAX protease family)
VIPLFVTGLLLSWLYLRTGSIWPPFAAHAAQNLLALAVTLAALGEA